MGDKLGRRMTEAVARSEFGARRNAESKGLVRQDLSWQRPLRNGDCLLSHTVAWRTRNSRTTTCNRNVIDK